MDNIKQAKFEILIHDVLFGIRGGGYTYNYGGVSPLLLIYDYNSCNTFAKIIIHNAKFSINKHVWKDKYPNIDCIKNDKQKMEAIKFWIECCNDQNNISEKYKFIFWALMILTVDDNNANEYLSLICELAQMMNVKINELKDIIYVIKCIYHENKEDYNFTSSSIATIFRGVCNLYK